MKIYTKTGDKGETGLANGKRVGKDAKVIALVGDLDEINSVVGICRVYGGHVIEIEEVLDWVQDKLFVFGGEIGGASLEKLDGGIGEGCVKKMENWIDEFSAGLPELRNFVLPGGNVLASYLFWVRTIVRRAERDLVSLNEEERVREVLIEFLNRLSDLFFVLARKANQVAGKEDVVWKLS